MILRVIMAVTLSFSIIAFIDMSDPLLGFLTGVMSMIFVLAIFPTER